MLLYIIIVVVIVIVGVVLFLTMRNRLMVESVNFDNEIEDIASAFEKAFEKCYVSGLDESLFIEQFTPVFHNASSLRHKLETFRIAPSQKLEKLISDYEAIPSFVKKHNEAIITVRLNQNRDYFNHCLAYPLDRQQRRSIVSEENNCLVVSSAGSGKTSSIVGKVKYLTEKLNIKPERILLISYTNKAAAELTERMDIQGLRGYTFHKLALDLIGQITEQKPSICDNTDALFVSVYRELLKNEKFRKSVVEYFIDYQVTESDWEKRKNERRQELFNQKTSTMKAMLPDMDGNPIYVRSQQEQKLCFALSSLGIRFRYEELYEHNVADETHVQYRPDFSIYYEDHGEVRRVYLEHFGVDEHGLVPVWFAKDKGITYEEANERYGDGITWKKSVHEKFGTTLLTTTSADFYYTDIKESLKKMFNQHGIPYQEKSFEELYDLIIPDGSKQEKAFIRLVVTFITLLKSSCKSLDTILNRTDDSRSLFIIKNIFKPVYDYYVDELRRRGQIDFTDAILNATELCRKHHPVQYDYIIVDEFQDISVDRYQFLLALRDGNPPAKLYCVGDDWQSIYRFSGSDMALFNSFSEFFGPTEINKIETTYRFGEPLVRLSSGFIQKNKAQITKNIHPFNNHIRTELVFHGYTRNSYCTDIGQLVDDIPEDKSIFLLGRYSFDDYYLSFMYQSVKDNGKFYYVINGRKIEFLTVHKSKGLEADYVIILQCNKDVYGFPSQISDDPVLDVVLTKSDKFPFGEERRLFYVAITRAKVRTIVMYDRRYPSVFVDEFLNPEKVTEKSYAVHPNANKVWTRGEDKLLLTLHEEGKDIKHISRKMGRSQTSIIMRLGKLGAG
ncbi:MAG: UvrD-helicase domain-containing protein [Prevotella sp.]|nr:UvrD-helicase domain-containing protein [Prevotella sp.]